MLTAGCLLSATLLALGALSVWEGSRQTQDAKRQDLMTTVAVAMVLAAFFQVHLATAINR